MKKIFPLTLALAASMLAMSCSSSSKKTKQTETAQELQASTATKQVFAYDAATTKVSWTAFKTTAKVGVGGTFDKIDVQGVEESEKAVEVFKNATFTIPVSSVNTKLAMRDKKIIKFFFGEMVEGENITGKVVSLSEDKGIVNITMNGQSRDVELKSSLVGNVLSLAGVINLDDFKAEASVSSLNKACEKLHAGKDGVSKLWSEVEIQITTSLKNAKHL